MDVKELIDIGDASVRKALANMFAIMDKDGGVLTRMSGAGDGDGMVFSPRIDCEPGRSMVLFDAEDKAQKAIDDILAPQDGDRGYCIYSFTPIDGGYEEKFDIIADDEDGEFDENGFMDDDDDDGMTLDDAIEQSKMDGENEIAKWLEEMRGSDDDSSDDDDDGDDEGKKKEKEKGKNGKKSENGDISLTEARRTLKRNGYQLVSQKNGKQKWKRDEGDSGVTLPCGDGVVESSDWNSVVESQGLDTDF